MIDSWLFAALCLIFLSICAILRIHPLPTRDDQLIAVIAAITIAAGAAIALSVLGKPVRTGCVNRTSCNLLRRNNRSITVQER